MSLLSAPEESFELSSNAEGELTACLPLPRDRTSLLERQVRHLDRFSKAVVIDRLRKIRSGGLIVRDGEDVHRFGPDCTSVPSITVHSPRFWRQLLFGGRPAVEEAFLRGDWSCDDLVSMMKTLMQNAASLEALDRGLNWALTPVRKFQNWQQRNTRANSRRNIAAHYDLSNDFFTLMLDSTMAYSSGIFESRDSTLEEASKAKFEQICRSLRLSPSDHLLEIGCGWGGLAVYAAENYGCRVTATTIAERQYEFAKEEISRRNLTDRITLLKQDYRDLQGVFDKVVSIEMIEAVGNQFIDVYFGKCNSLLKTGGEMLIQAITIEEQSYEQYRRSRDFIQQYIFPGGFLPAVSSIAASVGRSTDLKLLSLTDFGMHYAKTLSHWRERFWSNIDAVTQLGFDERFVRMWDYYLCYCQAGFEQRTTGVCHMLFAKP